MLKYYAIEKDFGIKVVLNSVNPNKLKGLDKNRFDEYMIQSRQQAINDIAINDFVKRVAGKPIGDEFGVMLDGSESLHLNYDLEFDELYDFAVKLFNKYYNSLYRQSFPWYDYMQIVKDSDLLTILNGNLIRAIIANDNTVQLNAPDILDDLVIGNMKFTPSGKEYPFEIISIIAYYNEKNIDITIDDIRKSKVHLSNGNEEPIHWGLYSCLIIEVTIQEVHYVLFDS